MEFRAATIDDVPEVCDVMTRVDPDEPWDPVLWKHDWETWTMSGFPSRSYLVKDGGGVAGLAELGIDTFATWVRDDEEFRPAELRATGYRPDRLSRRWELDLSANRDRLHEMAAPAREQVARQHVEVLTIADAESRDADVLRKLYEVDCVATQDIPTTVPHVSPAFDAWLYSLSSPGLRKDRMWVACAGSDVLGMSWLKYPVVRGNVWTDWTGVAPAARGRGIARALKLETLLQAIDVGVERVRTENDGQNAPILHLNAAMGYRPISGTRLWVKDGPSQE